MVIVGAFVAAVASFVVSLSLGSLLLALAAPFFGVPLTVLFLVWALRIPRNKKTTQCDDCGLPIGGNPRDTPPSL